MLTGATLTSLTHALPGTSAPTKTFGLPNTQPNQMSALTQSCHGLEPPSPPRTLHIITPSTHHQSTTDHDSDADSAVPHIGEAEDEYTLSAYGDISLSEVIVPPLPASTDSELGPLRPRVPQPRLRLKVQRPPMPKRRPSYYVSDPLPHTRGLEADECWPGSPRPTAYESPWIQHQPLVSPLSADLTSPWTQEHKPLREPSGSNLEKLFDKLLPHSPSIRLSPPGSPASQALCLPQATYEQKRGAQQGRNLLETDGAAKLPQSPPAPPAPRQDKPKPAPWRTRLPPRLPIPKWDM